MVILLNIIKSTILSMKYSDLVKGLSNVESGDKFILRDLIPDIIWRGISNSQKRQWCDRLSSEITQGLYKNFYLAGKDSKNSHLYTKK